MRELEVLGRGHLKLDWEERKAFFEEELGEQVRGEVKRLLEEALEAERTARVAVGRYVRDVETRCDFRNGYYQRDLGTRLGLLRELRIPRARGGYRSDCCRAVPTATGIGTPLGSGSVSAGYLHAPSGPSARAGAGRSLLGTDHLAHRTGRIASRQELVYEDLEMEFLRHVNPIGICCQVNLGGVDQSRLFQLCLVYAPDKGTKEIDT